jgi:DDE superfamily endonuclease
VETDHPLYKSFQASPGWLSKVLKRNNMLGVTLHGEASDISPEVRKATMAKWLVLFHAAIEDNDIQPACLYNPDEFGLFYQKLPNRMYVDSRQRKTVAGCKQMKDKSRITVMLCTAADESKVPLAVVGKAKKPSCFSLGDPPLPYHHQANAWFDRDVKLWWILTVFWPHHVRTQGDVPALLLLDNCTAHDVDRSKLPAKLIIFFLLPNMKSNHQPADMGMIASLKVGYKMRMLEKLLAIFDEEGGYEAAGEARKMLKAGCKGLDYGGKAHILDALTILFELWNKDDTYAKEDGIMRCWRKAGILPVSWDCDINNAVSRAGVSAKDKSLDAETCEKL